MFNKMFITKHNLIFLVFSIRKLQEYDGKVASIGRIQIQNGSPNPSLMLKYYVMGEFGKKSILHYIHD